MRHVPYDPKKITYPNGWKERAEAALVAVKAADDDKKSNEVNKHSNVWAELKPELKKVLHNKCWYTEAMQVGTDTDVDHFRPKNSVKNVKHSITQKEHQGYWWKAFDPANYRYSCIVANRLRRDLETGFVGGKADEFPLWDEAERAWSPDDDCDAEQYMLIDPCSLTDVALITFAENGEATERHSETVKEKAYRKAHNSILLYHLNHSDFVKERIKIRDHLEKQIQDAERYFKKMGTSKDDADNTNAYERAIEQLIEACSEKAPFSSFAISMLRPHRLNDSLEAVFIAG